MDQNTARYTPAQSSYGPQMTQSHVNQPTDERLRQLLAVEQRLQDLVRVATETAARRVAAACEEGQRRVAAAQEAAARADVEQARADRVAHDEALSAIDDAHQAALAAISQVSEARLDELARWALDRAIGDRGEPA
jgi:vacuolar-type H+-ATPase subunit H